MAEIPKVIKFSPIYKNKIWGGRKLESLFRREIPDGTIGESWELSVYGNEISVAENESIRGESFLNLLDKHSDTILGSSFKNKSFPLLIKIIDAKEKLSVQVHPDDAYALKYDPSSSGKKECWYVLSAEPGAQIVVGFKDSITQDTFRDLVSQNVCESILRSWEIKPGDVFLLNPGTIHAIGAGVVLLEVQQSSDSTYRVYDYGRTGDDGKPRELHLEKALAVLNFTASSGEEFLSKKLLHHHPFSRFLYTSNDKFRLESWEFLQAQYLQLTPISQPSAFAVIHVTSGSVYFEDTKQMFKKGETFFITAEGSNSHLNLYVSPKTILAYMTAGEDDLKFI